MKNCKNFKIACVALSIALMFSAAGCSDKKVSVSGKPNAKGEVAYPLETTETITFWKNMTSNVSQMVATENELDFTKKLIERTGINVEFVHPPAGQATEKFNLMLASGDITDIVQFSLSKTKEGADELITNGYVYELTPEFLADYAPNLNKQLEQDKELQKYSKTNSGKYYSFPCWRSNDNMTVFEGLMLRDDWLKELNLKEPETIAEWYTVLKAFKDKKGVAAPISFVGLTPFKSGAIIGAYNTKLDFYNEGGKVKYGPVQDGYKDFLTEMNKWYNDGLLDKNFASINKTELDAKMLNGTVGATCGLIGSGMGNWLASSDSDSFSLKAMRYPSVNAGGISEFGAKDERYYEPNVFIFAGSEKKELAARFLDYGYSEEGHMYYNFGVEGESYELKDGYPTFTDLILNNPDGLSATQALSKYTHCSYEGTYQMDERFFKQQYKYDKQKEAIDVWSETNAYKHILPGATSISGEENSEYSKIMNDINKYVNEMTTKFIMGIEPISKFEEFREHISALGIDKAIEIKQAGYDRHMAK